MRSHFPCCLNLVPLSSTVSLRRQSQPNNALKMQSSSSQRTRRAPSSRSAHTVSSNGVHQPRSGRHPSSEPLPHYDLPPGHFQQQPSFFDHPPGMFSLWTTEEDQISSIASVPIFTTPSWTSSMEYPVYPSPLPSWEPTTPSVQPSSLGLQPSSFLVPHGLPLVEFLPSNSPALSSPYPRTSDGYRSDDTEPTIYSPCNVDSTIWLNSSRMNLLQPTTPTSFTYPFGTQYPFTPPLPGGSSRFDVEELPKAATPPLSSVSTPPAEEDDILTTGSRSGTASPTAKQQRYYRDHDKALIDVKRKRTRTYATKDSDHVCVPCNQHFSRRHNLNVHKRRKHQANEDKTFFCDWSDCESSFTRSHDLNRHIKCVCSFYMSSTQSHTDPTFRCTKRSETTCAWRANKLSRAWTRCGGKHSHTQYIILQFEHLLTLS